MKLRACAGVLGIFSVLASQRPAFADETADDSVEACASAAERGQVARKEGDLARARGELRSCAVDTCPRVVREDCRQWLSEVDAELASPATVAPSAEAESSPSAAPTAIAPPPTPAPAPHRTSIVVRPLPATEREKPSSAPSATLGYAFGAAGLASLGAFTYFEIKGQDRYHELESGCGRTQSCPEDQVSAARTDFIAAGSFLAASAICLGVAAWQLIHSSSGSATVRVGPGAAGSRTALGAAWRF